MDAVVAMIPREAARDSIALAPPGKDSGERMATSLRPGPPLVVASGRVKQWRERRGFGAAPRHWLALAEAP